MTIPEELTETLVSSEDTLSGAIRFRGTRVPVETLLDNLLDGGTLNDFLEGFPDVSREQAEAVIRYEQNQLRQSLGLKRAS